MGLDPGRFPELFVFLLYTFQGAGFRLVYLWPKRPTFLIFSGTVYRSCNKETPKKEVPSAQGRGWGVWYVGFSSGLTAGLGSKFRARRVLSSRPEGFWYLGLRGFRGFRV